MSSAAPQFSCANPPDAARAGLPQREFGRFLLDRIKSGNLRLLLALFLLPSLSMAAARVVHMEGQLFEEAGSFFNIPRWTPFTLTVQLDLDVSGFDWDGSQTVGLYHFPSAPLALDFGGHHFESAGVWLQIWSGYTDANWGFIFWSDAAFTAEGFNVARNGIYMQYLTGDPSVAPDDTLSSFRAYDPAAVLMPAESFYMLSRDFSYSPPTGTRLLSEPTGEPRGFTVTDVVPEPAGTALLASGAVIVLLSKRRRNV